MYTTEALTTVRQIRAAVGGREMLYLLEDGRVLILVGSWRLVVDGLGMVVGVRRDGQWLGVWAVDGVLSEICLSAV